MKKQRKLTESTSGLMQFQSCRRRWLLSRQWGKSGTAPALWFGTAIHKGLEGYFNAKKERPNHPGLWTEWMREDYTKWYEKQTLVLKDEYGILWEQAKVSFENMVDIGWKMLTNYQEYDMQADIQIKPLLVEKLLYIPLGKRNYLSMKMDLIATIDDQMTGVVDHKTSAGRHATGQTLDIDEQMTSYAYGFWRLTDRKRLPDVIVYDVLKKEVPAEPRVLKNGELSKAKNQQTTYDKFIKAIDDNDLDIDDYEEVLAALKERGWRDFFDREASPRNEAQILNFEQRALTIFEEMRGCLDNPARAYPSPSSMKCPHCPFLSVCNAMEDGSDAQFLLDSSYTKKVDSPWLKRKHVED